MITTTGVGFLDKEICPTNTSLAYKNRNDIHILPSVVKIGNVKIL
jgi:hypothetical protein